MNALDHVWSHPVRFPLLALCIICLFIFTTVSFAQSIDPVGSLATCVQTLDAPNILRLSGCNYAHADDQIVIYSRTSLGLMEAVSDEFMDDEIWVFSVNGDDQANLIIDFYRSEGLLFAALYDDQNGDGTVDYYLENGFVVIEESAFPTIRVKALDDWWIQNEIVNYNLTIEVDGLVKSQFWGPNFVNGQWTGHTSELPLWRSVIPDGDMGWVTQVRDVNRDGRPDFYYTLNSIPFPLASGIHRFELAANSMQDENPPTHGAVFWPYLGPTTSFNKEYHRSDAPIQMDWERSKIVQISEFVASRANDHNWFIYSITPFETSTVEAYAANFENPFAFYDLASDLDGYPELQIRNEHVLAHDPYDRDLPTPLNNIRYSWDQDNNQSWDFGLGLAGRNPSNEVITIDGIPIFTIPYENYPQWITDNTWDAATFVAVEGERYWTSEGIYEALVPSDIREDYLTGFADSIDLSRFSTSSSLGLRLEYAIDLGTQPYLYFSNLDRRLHLLNANEGVWQVTDQERVRYGNLNNDAHIDSWERYATDVEQGEEILQESLYIVGNYLIYFDVQRSEIALRNAPTVDYETFRTLPPRNHADWQNLAEQLNENLTDVTPIEFETMYDQFSGSEVRIINANMRDFRLTENRFQLILETYPGFTKNGDLELAMPTTPGEYVLDSVNDQIRVRALTPPHVNLSISPLTENSTDPISLHPYEISILFRNDGLQGVENLNLQLTARDPFGQERSLYDGVISLAGESTGEISSVWTPNIPGQWTIKIAAAATDTDLLQPVVLHHEMDIPVLPIDTLNVSELSETSGVLLAPIAVLLFIVISAFTSFFVLVVREHRGHGSN